MELFLINKNFLFMEKLHRYYSIIPYFIDSTNFYDGYWQTSKYFEPFREELLEIFSPSDIILKKVFDWRKSIDSSNTVAVHIRRGDYLNNINRNSLKGGNVIGDVDYYLSAIKIIKEKVKNPLFCFFSDDITWCKDTFSNKLDNSICFLFHFVSMALCLQVHLVGGVIGYEKTKMEALLSLQKVNIQTSIS